MAGYHQDTYDDRLERIPDSLIGFDADKHSRQEQHRVEVQQQAAYHKRLSIIYHGLAAEHAAKADRLLGEGA
jgi:hypothetical protein